MIGKFLKEARGEKTLEQIATVAKIDKSYLSKVERDILIPKLDKLIPLSKAYGIKFSVLISKLLEISEEELVKLMLRDEKTEYAKNNLNEIKSLSESQRVMVKSHLKNLFANKYQTTDFTQNEEFLKELNIESNTANRWFRILNDYSLDDKFSEMLVLLAKTSENFFDDMNVVIKIEEAIVLNLISSEELSQGIPCIIVSASKLFLKLKGLSIKSLSLLSTDILSQINDISAFLMFQW